MGRPQTRSLTMAPCHHHGRESEVRAPERSSEAAALMAAPPLLVPETLPLPVPGTPRPRHPPRPRMRTRPKPRPRPATPRPRPRAQRQLLPRPRRPGRPQHPYPVRRLSRAHRRNPSRRTRGLPTSRRPATHGRSGRPRRIRHRPQGPLLLLHGPAPQGPFVRRCSLRRAAADRPRRRATATRRATGARPVRHRGSADRQPRWQVR